MRFVEILYSLLKALNIMFCKTGITDDVELQIQLTVEREKEKKRCIKRSIFYGLRTLYGLRSQNSV